MSRESTALAVVETAPQTRLQNNPLQSVDPVPILDTARFEHMQRVAQVMGSASLVPDALRYTREGRGDNAQLIPLDTNTVVANCFLIVNQAVRWNMDPFAVAQCVSIISGKLCYEGKLIAAVLEAKLGVKLEYEFNDKQGDDLAVVVTGTINGEPVRTSNGTPKKIEGTVGQWKTDRTGSPWKNAAPNHRKKMLGYRGAREWARVWEPGTMLGVYTDDEMEHLENHEVRSSRARDVTAVASIAGPKKQLPPDPDATDTETTEQKQETPAKVETSAQQQPKQTEKKALPPNPDEGREPETSQQVDWMREGYLAHGRDIARSAFPSELKTIARVKHRGLWQAGWDKAAEDAANLKTEEQQRSDASETTQQTHEPLDIEKLRAEFAEALNSARSVDNCKEAWNDYIEPVKLQLPESDFRDVQRMFNNTKGKFSAG